MRILLSCLGLGLLCTPCPAESVDEVDPEVLRKTLEWMQSVDPEKRAAAFRGVHLLGPEAVRPFEKAMRKARLFHEKSLYRILSGDENPIRRLGDALAELKDERERVYQLIKTDYKKDAGEIKMLHREMEKITKDYERLVRMLDADTSELQAQVDRVAHALADLDQQLARFEEPDAEEDNRPLAERKQDALADSFEGEVYLKNLGRWESLEKEVEHHEKTTAYNEELPWPNSDHREFVAHLNHQRVVLGLQPFKLEEKLTKAALGHSEDMKRLGFFAHESPIEEKRTPAMRARKAGYTGGWAGENIAAGYNNPMAAYNGWFGSDGHRFIMFAKGPSEMGLGRAGNHWTFMSGRGK